MLPENDMVGFPCLSSDFDLEKYSSFDAFLSFNPRGRVEQLNPRALSRVNRLQTHSHGANQLHLVLAELIPINVEELTLTG